MDKGPLVKEKIEEGAKLIGEFASYKPLQAAFWLKAGEPGYWFLHLASDQIIDSTREEYGEVIRILKRQQAVALDSMEVKVMGIDSRLVQAVMKMQQKYAPEFCTRLHGGMLGDTYFEEAYLYPVPITASA